MLYGRGTEQDRMLSRADDGASSAPVIHGEAGIGRTSLLEYAAELFLSPRTVGHHLYRAFPGLGITSRTELPLLLGQDR
ncbi:hypothetical protein ACFU6I_30780 [Streptomyces sp. NPDC057486]|uniref:hypothetical protein n=1 Tax=Streptomyces sp. NPDC057486 TaxID=3346145 RepID=UPI0036A7362C